MSSIQPIQPNRIAAWVVLLAQLPGLPPRPAGVLLLDPMYDKLHIALAASVSVDEEIKEIWDGLGPDLAERALDLGGARLLDSLEQDLSLFLQIKGPRQYVMTADPVQTLTTLFQEHVL